MTKDGVARAAAPYTWLFLACYNMWVIRLSNRFGWRCPAGVMSASYQEYLGDRHLEVGPGSGWYLAHAVAPRNSSSAITLMDLNPAPLGYSRRRLAALGCEVHTTVGSVLEPVPEAIGADFDSIGLNFVLHCVPGSFAEKGVAFGHLARVLDDEGTLFGSTILGQRPVSLFGRGLSRVYRGVGAFNNRDDDRAGLEAALRNSFEDVSIWRVGEVTLFRGRRPRR